MQSVATLVCLGGLLLMMLACTAAGKAATPVTPSLRVSDVMTSDGEPLAPRNTHHGEDGDDDDGEDIEMEPEPVVPADDDASSASDKDMDDRGAASAADEESELMDDTESEDELGVYEDDEELAF